MDHIQLPSDGLEPIAVPHAATLMYDGLDFETYPARVSFPRHDDLAGWQEIDSDKTAGFAQSWLYFGLIDAFFGREIDREQFIANTTQGQSFVTSAALLPLLDDWRASDASDESAEKERLDALLRVSLTALQRFSLLPQSSLSPMPEILLSARILITTLCVATNSDGLVVAQLRPWTSSTDPAADLLRQKLLEAGWCPWKVRQILSEYSCLAIYYISRLRDPTAHHISHAACTEDRCIGNNVNMANYATRHTDSSCACQHALVPEAKMRSIIDDGGIPVVRVKFSKTGDACLQVKRATPRTRYIAISHVWSDGLGNPHANSLPQCQLKRFSRSVKLLTPPILDFSQGYMSIPQLNISFDGKRMMLAWGTTEWFWLDTLCIPVGSDDHSIFLKSKAINQMAAIYSGAHQVLVLDSVMQACNIAGRDPCHVLAQLSALAWLGRCWTYQEGALALSLQVQCADCSFAPTLFGDVAIETFDSSDNIYVLLPGTTTAHGTWSRIGQALAIGIKWTRTVTSDALRGLRGLPTSSKRKIRALLARHIYHQIGDVVGREMRYDWRSKNPFLLSGNTMQDFVLCWNSLAQRTTTMGGDVHVIIANLLRFNAFSILAMKTLEERITSILWSLPAIPLSLLFNRSKQRVRPTEQHANRWMPLWPDWYTITELPALEIQGGVLTLASNNIRDGEQRPVVLMLDLLIQAHDGPTELLVESISETRSNWFRVVLHRQPGDQFDSGKFQSTVFVIHPGRSHYTVAREEIPAACLHANAILYKHPDETTPDSCQGNAQTRKAQLLTTFDCPATAYFLGTIVPPAYSHLPKYSASSPQNYTLAVEHDVPQHTRPLPQRPQNPAFLVVTALLLMLSHPFSYFLCAMNALVIYQDVTEHTAYPFYLGVLSKLTIVTHSHYFLAFLYILPPLAILPTALAALGLGVIPFVIGIVYVILKAEVREMGAIDKAVLGLLVAGHSPQILMAAVVRWYINPRVWKAWLETYEPDWEPGKTDGLLKTVLTMTEGWSERLTQLEGWFRR